MIIFTSDNGPHQEGGADPEFFDSNGPLKGFKRDLYEGGIRVPMIASWKGKIEAGSTSDHISAFWDVMPTIAELAEVQTPQDIDGISFLPTLLGNKDQQKKHEHLYWEFHERGGRIAVRKGEWKAVKYKVGENPDALPELYNLANDIGETNNVADEYPEITREMDSLMRVSRTPSPVFRFASETYLDAP